MGEERVIWLCLAARHLSGFGEVKKQFSGGTSFSRQRRWVWDWFVAFFYNPQVYQNGYECFFGGKILDWFEYMWARILCMRFWSFFFLECSKLLPLLIGLKICVCKTKNTLQSLWLCFQLLLKEIKILSWCHHFRSPVQVFSCTILSICHLKYPYSCFSSICCFIVFVFVVLFVLTLLLILLATENNLSLLSLIHNWRAYNEASIQPSMLPNFFLFLSWHT